MPIPHAHSMNNKSGESIGQGKYIYCEEKIRARGILIEVYSYL